MPELMMCSQKEQKSIQTNSFVICQKTFISKPRSNEKLCRQNTQCKILNAGVMDTPGIFVTVSRMDIILMMRKPVRNWSGNRNLRVF